MSKKLNQKSVDIFKIARELRMAHGLAPTRENLCESVARAEVEYDNGRRPAREHAYSSDCDCPSCQRQTYLAIENSPLPNRPHCHCDCDECQAIMMAEAV